MSEAPAAPERGPSAATAPASALAVYAHPDDPDVSCGGTLASWSDAGTAVHVVVCTSGEKGTSDASVDPRDLAAARASEVAAAGAVVGVATQHLLGIPDGELADTAELRCRLVELVRRLRPEVLVCPDPEAVFFGEEYYNHRDHRCAGWLALDAVSPAAALPLYFPEAGPPHRVETAYLSGTLQPDCWIDVSATLERKVSAVSCHVSQVGPHGEWAAEMVRARAEEAGRQGGMRLAESFRRLRLAGP
ncbi:MAG: PIG-L deacetylase family protein [Acidimicrobiales bacterium]